jgi:SAM-dependent methyltransferase
MQRCVEKYLDAQRPTIIADVGSMDVNGSYRQIFHHPQWRYIGIDVAAGKNVDIVLKEPYHFPLGFSSVDVVISGQTFEHVEFFWLTWMEMVRILRPGGLAIMILHRNMLEHRYPVDCWRFFPDAMNAFARYGGLSLEEVSSYDFTLDNAPEWLKFIDTVGVFRKPRKNIKALVKELLFSLTNRILTPKC